MRQTLSLKLKICLLGDGAVGKTSLIDRFVTNEFSEDYLLTVGTRTSKKEILISNPRLGRDIHLTLLIWDIMGQYNFRKILHSTFLKGAKGAIIVCDLTRRETLENLDRWVDTLFVEGQVMPFLVVANKNDLKSKYEFNKNDVDKIAKAYMTTTLTASAKTGENVEKAFQLIGEKIIEYMMETNNPILIRELQQPRVQQVTAA
jgi:small GTP-binding protein